MTKVMDTTPWLRRSVSLHLWHETTAFNSLISEKSASQGCECRCGKDVARGENASNALWNVGYMHTAMDRMETSYQQAHKSDLFPPTQAPCCALGDRLRPCVLGATRFVRDGQS
jgi:hypothetical protein